MHPLRPSRRARRLGVVLGPLVVVGLGLGATGCGDDDDDAGSNAATDTTGATQAASNADNLGAADSDAATTADVIAVDYHFEHLPGQIGASTELTLHNDSSNEVHELVAMAIPEGETRSVDELVALPEAELGAALPGEPALVMVAPPGEDAFTAIGDGTLEAGRYLVLCFIPTGADPDEYMQAAQAAQDGPPQVAGGPPHFTAGMYAELVVS